MNEHDAPGEDRIKSPHDPRDPLEARVENPEVSHEHTDVNVRGILLTAGGLFAFGVMVSLVALGVFNWLYREERSGNQPSSPFAAARAGESTKDLVLEIPTPRLEGLEYLTGQEKPVRPRELFDARRLEEYGWVGKPDSGVVHVPIETAMQLLVRKQAAAGNAAPEEKREEAPVSESKPAPPPRKEKP
jgi:hypothetical protein